MSIDKVIEKVERLSFDEDYKTKEPFLHFPIHTEIEEIIEYIENTFEVNTEIHFCKDNSILVNYF